MLLRRILLLRRNHFISLWIKLKYNISTSKLEFTLLQELLLNPLLSGGKNNDAFVCRNLLRIHAMKCWQIFTTWEKNCNFYCTKMKTKYYFNFFFLGWWEIHTLVIPSLELWIESEGILHVLSQKHWQVPVIFLLYASICLRNIPEVLSIHVGRTCCLVS